MRVPWLDANPDRVLKLLELLKDDPATLVRRSVANNLNDLGKVHPALLVRTCEAWLRNASAERKALVEHALRSAVKRGDSSALKLLGFGKKSAVVIENARFVPKRVPIGGRATFDLDFELLNAFDNTNFNPAFNPGGGDTIFQVTSGYTDINTTFDPGGRLGQIVTRFSW